MTPPPAKILKPLFNIEPIIVDAHHEPEVLQGCELCQQCLLMALLQRQQREHVDAAVPGQPRVQAIHHTRE